MCGGRLSVQPAIEVGHIFKLETFHSEALDATYLDEDGRERPVVMGATGSVRPERSPRWWSNTTTSAGSSGRLRSLRTTSTCSSAAGSEEVEQLAAALAEELSAAGRDVLLDDRDARPGEKFADADLLGCPSRVTVGRKSLEDGAVDVRRRADGGIRAYRARL